LVDVREGLEMEEQKEDDMKEHVEKATIIHFDIGYEEHEILYIVMEFSGSLWIPRVLATYNNKNDILFKQLNGLLKVFNVRSVSELMAMKGQMCKMKRKEKFGMIEGVGHIMEDRWLDWRSGELSGEGIK
jgi:hypothetical protein